jgi:release factor glutamine methyltransferase
MPETPWTIGRLLTWTTEFLREKGADAPRLDAEILLAHARGCARIELYTAFEDVADETLRETFRELVGKRAAGMPVAYLVGHREFFSLNFYVSSDVLIPRPETELLVVRTLDLAKSLVREFSDDLPLRIADVGTGSGIVAICCAKQFSDCHVTAIDISEAALSVARNNANQHKVANRIDLIHSDLFPQAPSSDSSDTRTYHLIVSNPPYVTSGEMKQLPATVGQYEPHLALDGGEQGTTVIERLLIQAAEQLCPGGWLLIEVSPSIVEQVEQLVLAEPTWDLHKTEKDLAGHPRVVQAQRRTL